MRRHFPFFVLLLLLHLAARGQTRIDYDYWFDNDRSTLRSGSSTTADMQLEIDVRDLTMSFHTLHLYVKDSEGELSPPMTRQFYKVPRIEGIDRLTLRSYIDNAPFKAEEIPVTSAAYQWSLDASGLSQGLHHVYLQAVLPNGEITTSYSDFFLRVPTSAEEHGMRLYYYLDGNELTTREGTLTGGNTYHFDLVMSQLPIGVHSIAYYLSDGEQTRSKLMSAFFCRVPQTADTKYFTLRSFVDNQPYKEENVTPTGGVWKWTIDADSLSQGIHHIYVQALMPDGEVAASHSDFFLREPMTSEATGLKLYYFIDDDELAIREGTLSEGSYHFNLDASSLPIGMHSITYYLSDGRQTRSKLMRGLFCRVPQTADTEYLTLRSFVDNQPFTEEKAVPTNGVWMWNLDASSLHQGVHHIYLQALLPNGEVAASHSDFFLREPMEAELNDMKLYYFIDNEKMAIHEGIHTDGSYQFDLDLKSIPDGLHSIAYFLSDSRNNRSKVLTSLFWKEPRNVVPVTRYCYWLNDGTDTTFVDVADIMDPFELVTMLPVEPQPIRSKKFAFAIEEEQPVVYAVNDITLRFFNQAGRSDEATATYTDITVREPVVNPILLAHGNSHTDTRPADNAINWYKVEASQGDSLMFRLSAEATMQVFSPQAEELMRTEGSNVLNYCSTLASAAGTYYIAVHDVTNPDATEVTIDYRRVSADGLVHVTDIEVVSPIVMEYGESMPLADYVTLLPADAYNKNYEAVSMNEEVVIVTLGANGQPVITAAGTGTAIVQIRPADAPALEAEITVIVKSTLTGIAFAEAQQTAYQGEDILVAWKLTPANATDIDVKLDFDNATFAVNPDDATKLTIQAEAAVGEHIVVVRAFDTDGHDLAISDTLRVTVRAHVKDIEVVSPIVMEYGESMPLADYVTLLPADAYNKNYEAVSTNEEVVSVTLDADGQPVITAVGTGTAVLQIHPADAPALEAEITVIVKSALTGIAFAETQQTAYQGEDILVAWKLTPANATDIDVKLDFDNATFAVNPDDATKLTIQAEATVGEHIVVVRAFDTDGHDLGLSDTLRVTVRAHVKEIQIAGPLTLTAGETAGVDSLITVMPADAHDRSYTISTNDETIVTVSVDSLGRWTAQAVSAGSTTLTVTSTDVPTVTAEIAVTVTVDDLTSPLYIALTELKAELDNLAHQLSESMDTLRHRAAKKELYAVRVDTLKAMLDCFSFDTPATKERYAERLTEYNHLDSQMAAENGRLETEAETLTTQILGLDGTVSSLFDHLAMVKTLEQADELQSLIEDTKSHVGAVAAQVQNYCLDVFSFSLLVDEGDTHLSALKADMIANVEGMTPQYALTLEHLSHLSIYPKLRLLDLSGATIEGNALPEGVFSDLGLVCVSLPASITSVAGGAFSGCTNLGAIVWNCGIEVTESALSGIGNPNLLLYVGDYAQALRSGMRNVVADGLAGRITLTDNIGEDGTHGPSAFYVPQAFRVQNDISYTHVYTQQTPIGDCGGWETLALPFDVETITHAVNGEAVPFAAYTGGGKRPFWLCRLTEEEFVDAGKIEANTPYIISMPNNPQYSPFYCLNGEITFTARGVTVPATVLHTDSRGSASFIPTFSRIAASPSVYALNVGEQRWGRAEGSLFDRDYRDVQPFEAYRTVATAGTPYLAIGDELRSETTDVIFVEVSEEGMMYNLQGIPVINPEKGVYIRNGQKIIVVK